MPIDETHKVMNTPKGNFTLWRYMDIPSFLYFLTNNSLAFIRADLFEDRYEGTFPKITANLLDIEADKLIQQGKLLPQYKNFSKINEQDKHLKYLSCWCKESHQMVHMWKIYSKEDGVAIETDYLTLKESILSKETIYPTDIKYIDFENEHVDWLANGLTMYTLKRKEYKSENELRLIISFPRILEDKLQKYKTHEERIPQQYILYKNTPVIDCQVNVKKMIKKIYISPYSPNWYYPLILSVLNKFNLEDIEVLKSDL